MKWIAFYILIFSIYLGCGTSENQEGNKSTEDSVTISFNYEQSKTDFRISDSLGFSITFHKHPDSIYYHYFRFRLPEEERLLYPNLPVLSRLWKESNQKIDIHLTSFSVGYPLEYEDILTNHIQAFAASERWINHVRLNGKKTDYQLIEEILYQNNIYALNELLEDFQYEVTGFSIEKVGFVEPERLLGLGFDESLMIPMPYMVWINIQPTDQNVH